MTRTGRRVRLLATLLVLGALLAGSLVGEDHHFPLGPFRMFATSGKPHGVVRTPGLIGVVDGREFRIDPRSFGLRRAELEGQANRFRKPELLAAIAERYQRDGRRLDELRLVQVQRRLRDSRRIGPSTVRVLDVWRAPG